MYYKVWINSKSVCILLFFIFLSFFKLTAQSDLRNYRNFFTRQLTEYSEWLTSKNIDQLLRVDSIEVTKNNLILFLGSPYNDTYTSRGPDSLAVIWNNLKNDFYRKTGNKLEDMIFSRFFFLMDVGRDSAIINIYGKNPFLFTVNISCENNRVVALEHIANPKPAGTIEIDPLQLTRIKHTTKDKLSSRSLHEIRKEISKCLISYYKSKGSFWHTADVKIIQDYMHELVFEVTMLSNEILNDNDLFSFFEYIRISIKVEQLGNDVLISYDIQGKYGSGIFYPPRKNDYKSIENKFPGYIEDYEKFVKNKIRKHLTE